MIDYKILEEFGIKVVDIKKSAQAALTEVYVVNNTFVLRGRKKELNSIEKLHKELDLLHLVQPKISISLPQLKTTKSGGFFVEKDGYLWTVYPLIKGNIVCSWFDLEKANDNLNRKLFSFMKTMHDNTKGIFQENHLSYSFLEDIKEKLKSNAKLISKESHQRVKRAIREVSKNLASNTIKDLCFIHGDFHHGNIVYNESKEIVGILDLDWCRVGYYLEDIAFTIMMFLRHYQTDHFTFNEDEFLKIVDFYKVDKNRLILLKEYLILYGFFDVCLFNEITGLSKKEYFLNYQKTLLNEICKQF